MQNPGTGSSLASGTVESEERRGSGIVGIGKLIDDDVIVRSLKSNDYVKIDKFVIMPNHIHAIIVLDGKAAGASPRPTLPDIMCAYKSLTTRECNKISNIKGRQIFQASFYEKVIRSEEGYLEVWQYIDENPRKWQNDEYFLFQHKHS